MAGECQMRSHRKTGFGFPWGLALWPAPGRLGGMSATQPSSELPAPRASSEVGGRHATFVTTHWSVVLTARRSDSTRARAALARLCQAYWYPLYAYVRRRGYYYSVMWNLRKHHQTFARNNGRSRSTAATTAASASVSVPTSHQKFFLARR